jgi:hypothetical protein
MAEVMMVGVVAVDSVVVEVIGVITGLTVVGRL